ncbi:unnamed protein product [marine sediment metagenome]|uniref:Uncharacterized protein n=1 Tax=marine sediment metagenome TaxID=412755 RepID=X1V347_9ZZZZ
MGHVEPCGDNYRYDLCDRQGADVNGEVLEVLLDEGLVDLGNNRFGFLVV